MKPFVSPASTHPHRSKRSGFTLLELLVVLAIIGVMTSIGITTLFSMLDYWNLSKGRMELYAKAENALNQIRQDFAAAIPSALNPAPLEGKSAVVQDKGLYWGQSMEDDSVALSCHLPIAEGTTVAGTVKYFVDREKNNALVREAGVPGGNEAPNRMEVVQGVLKFNVEYASPETDGGWASEWSSATLPPAVRVTIVLANPDNAAKFNEQVVRQAVFPVYVE